MSKTIAWKFKGLSAIFLTQEDKFDATVNKLRIQNYLSPEHQIEILNDGNTTTTESVANDIPVSNSPINIKKRKSVSKPVESDGAVEETPVMRPLLDDVDSPSTESDSI